VGAIGNHDAEPGGLSGGRALVRVVMSPAEDGHKASGPTNLRTNAPFLTQLIATADGHPQTRERRRADPNWATTAYAVMMQAPAISGREVHESR
jgi:hypothetical protein